MKSHIKAAKKKLPFHESLFTKATAPFGLRSASVIAKRTSTRCSATSRACSDDASKLALFTPLRSAHNRCPPDICYVPSLCLRGNKIKKISKDIAISFSLLYHFHPSIPKSAYPTKFASNYM